MRCLYCGKELALLKRLRGGGEFCSEAHKNSYQEEYNRLGLSRLLQARSKAGESQTAQAPQAPPPTPAAPVAVAEEVEEIPAKKPARPPKPAAPEVIAAPEPPPPALAGFTFEMPAILGSAEPAPYFAPWMPEEESDAAPIVSPAWRLEGPNAEPMLFSLRSGDRLPLELQPRVCDGSYPMMDTSATPQEVRPPKVNLSMPVTATWQQEFQPGGTVSIEIAPRPSESNCYASLNGAVDFTYVVEIHAFDLLGLSPAGIAYPAEECDVTLPGSWTNGVISEAPADLPPNPIPDVAVEVAVATPIDLPVDLTVPPIPQESPSPDPAPEPAAVAPPAATPRAALEALSKLHQDMREREEAAPAEAPRASIPEVPPMAAEVAPAPVVEPAVSTLPDPTPLEPSPREAGEMLAISLKSFAPPKAIPVIDASVLLGNGQPLLPRLKALPLRPKVAPAPKGFGQQPKPAAAPSPAEPKKAVERATPQPPPAEAKQKAPAVSKPLQPGPTPKSAFVAKPVVAPEATPAPAPEAPKAAQPPPAKKAAGPVDSAKEKPPATPPAGPPKTEPVSKPVAVKSAPAAPAAQPPAAPPPAKIAPPPKNDPPAKAAAVASRSSESTDHTVPNFGAVVNTSMFGSLKVKIGLGALIAVLSIGVYIGATSKSKMSATSARASDGVGPSIMVGEGGWVEGWAGDPVGSHNGRQITIYRPSLKLSDYRFEFQGQIENKSIGWIFRAADPDNYYAMKLELVSPELPLKLALYKYLVLKGRQVQVGRVPIDVPVKSDTVFSIRVDVRGPKFNTYVQGQAVDFWTDDQLRSGGVGFLNERSERGKVKSVALSYLSGGTK